MVLFLSNWENTKYTYQLRTRTHVQKTASTICWTNKSYQNLEYPRVKNMRGVKELPQGFQGKKSDSITGRNTYEENNQQMYICVYSLYLYICIMKRFVPTFVGNHLYLFFPIKQEPGLGFNNKHSRNSLVPMVHLLTLIVMWSQIGIIMRSVNSALRKVEARIEILRRWHYTSQTTVLRLLVLVSVDYIIALEYDSVN